MLPAANAATAVPDSTQVNAGTGRYVGRGALAGGVAVAAGNALSEDDQWRKLELVVETARATWG